MVAEIHLGRLNTAQAAAKFEVTRQTYSIEQVLSRRKSKRTACPSLAPQSAQARKTNNSSHTAGQSKSERPQGEDSHFRAGDGNGQFQGPLLFDTNAGSQGRVRHRYRKKVHYQALCIMLKNHPQLHIRQLEGAPLRRSDWF